MCVLLTVNLSLIGETQVAVIHKNVRETRTRCVSRSRHVWGETIFKQAKTF